MMRRILVAAALVCLPTAAAAQVSGTVVDEAMQPVVGARVSVQASDLEALTDAGGNFDIAMASGDVVVVAAAKGFFNEAAPVTAPSSVALQLEAVPQQDDASYVFSDPIACANCHPQQVSEWNGSPMADAGVNSWVYDIYDGTGTAGGDGGFVYLNDSVHAQAAPESECRSCHQPEAWVYEPYTAMAPLATATPTELHGVTCEICHKMADVDITKPNFPGIWPGVVTMTRPASPVFAIAYGALGDTSFVQPTTMRSSYQPQLVAEICATCHQDKNDHDLDGDFEDDGGVISEPTYLEWAASRYGDPADTMYTTCVDCHMPPNDAPDACAVNMPSLDRPAGDVRSHVIEGTTAAFLDNAASMTIELQQVGNAIEALVTVANDQTGHHVPTGVTIRNMILLVEASRLDDGAALEQTGGDVLHDLAGVGDPADGYYAGFPGKIYAKLNHDEDGNGPTFFTDATGIQFDTRIPALESDATTYTFAVPVGGAEVEVRARLIYRRSWRALVDAKGWTTDGHGKPLEDVMAPHFGHLMEEESAQIVAAEVPLPECEMDEDCGDGERCVDNDCVAESEPGPATPADDDDGGCGCGVPRGSNGNGWWLVMVGVVVAGLRRTREPRRSARSR
jgi:MYXO-CTERM domain-containing protein